MSKNHSSESGLTLVELLAVLVLGSIISIFIFTLIVQTNETTREVQIESAFRDEADIIVSSLMKAIYETKQTHIIENFTDANNSYLNVTTSPAQCLRDENGRWILNTACRQTLKPIGFRTEAGQTKLYLKDQVYEVSNRKIRIQTNSHIVGDPNSTNSYEIILKLQYVSSRGGKEIPKEMEFRNEIQPF